MADDAVAGIVETLQASHINRLPDPAHDANPSTTASKRSPVRLRSQGRRRSSSPPTTAHDARRRTSSSDIPIDILEPQPRRTQSSIPPLPDLRFEQSYLARIKPYSDMGRYGMVAFYTFWDHFFMPLTQGMIWRLAVFGWRHWNTAAAFRGQNVGARVRRWWWGVNNWSLPERGGGSGSGRGAAQGVGEQVEEFVVGEFGNAGAD